MKSKKLRPVGPVNDLVSDSTVELLYLAEDSTPSDVALVSVDNGGVDFESGTSEDFELEAPGCVPLSSMVSPKLSSLPHSRSRVVLFTRRTEFELLLMRLRECKGTYLEKMAPAPLLRTRIPSPCMDSLAPPKFDICHANHYQEGDEKIHKLIHHLASHAYLEQVAKSIKYPIEKDYKFPYKDSQIMANSEDFQLCTYHELGRDDEITQSLASWRIVRWREIGHKVGKKW